MKHASEAGSKPPVTADRGKGPDFPWNRESILAPYLKSKGRGRDKSVRRDGAGQLRNKKAGERVEQWWALCSHHMWLYKYLSLI